MQTSPRMWLEFIKNWIKELLSTPTQGGKYVNVGVQVDTSKSTWQTVKQWFLEVCSVRSSELDSIGLTNVDKWRTGLDSIQSVNHHDSESPLTSIVFSSPDNSTLDKLVDPDDSVSQVSEVVSELVDSNNIYDITDPEVLQNLIEDPSVYSYFDIADKVHYVVSDTLLTVDPSIMNSFM